MTHGPIVNSTAGILRLPQRVLFGDGTVAATEQEAPRFGREALLVCDPFFLDTQEFATLLRRLRSSGVNVSVESEVVPELPRQHVERLVESYRSRRLELIIAIGGGSAMDLAKLLALGVTHSGEFEDWYGDNKVPGPVIPLIAIPTTAGTGSEVTGVAVLSDPNRELKVGISSPYLVPRVAIVDPLLGVGAPPGVTAASGADALVHAVEAHTAGTRILDWSQELPVFIGSNTLGSVLSLEAIRLIVPNLPTAVRNGDDLAARRAMAKGSLLAGMSFGSAGTHLSHAIQYPIGALTHTPHGVGTGMLLPFVLNAILPTAVDPLAQIAETLNISGADAEISARGVVDALTEVMNQIGLPPDLRSMGVKEDDVPRIVDLSLTVERLVTNSTHTATRELVKTIVDNALNGIKGDHIRIHNSIENRKHA